MEYPKFSVLMSLYIKEKVEYFEECMKSLLNQTVLPAEIVIVFDGPLTEEMYRKVDEYVTDYPGLFKLVKNEVNKGLGLALADGIPACTYDLIARMDTDDIAREDRFEKQLKLFMENPSLDICGSDIAEFETTPNDIVSFRTVPTSEKEIREYQKRRDAFNHMTVMYKKQAVLSAGNYQDCPLLEDTLLWVNMLKNGCVCTNIHEPLVYARIGTDMYKRRGGLRYFCKYKNARKKVRETGYISAYDYYITIFVQLFVCLLPNRMRGLLFTKVLHT